MQHKAAEQVHRFWSLEYAEHRKQDAGDRGDSCWRLSEARRPATAAQGGLQINNEINHLIRTCSEINLTNLKLIQQTFWFKQCETSV